MKTVNESTGFTVTVSPRDTDGAAVTPTSMRYRIDCITTGSEVLGWTAVATPSASNAIAVPGTINVIVNSGNARERKQMVTEFTSGGVVTVVTYDWLVKNIHGVS